MGDADVPLAGAPPANVANADISSVSGAFGSLVKLPPALYGTLALSGGGKVRTWRQRQLASVLVEVDLEQELAVGHV